jgi:hypothetical protein
VSGKRSRRRREKKKEREREEEEEGGGGGGEKTSLYFCNRVGRRKPEGEIGNCGRRCEGEQEVRN